MEVIVIPSEVEKSSGVIEEQFHGILQLRSASLRMTAGHTRNRRMP
jgi:hypothetical protein